MYKMPDYKNTSKGRAVIRKYGDLLSSSRPAIPTKHPKMDIQSRAKIFSPFAALRGYEDEIRAEGIDHLKGSRIELSEDEKNKLSEKLQHVTKGMNISIQHYDNGFYKETEGIVIRMDLLEQMIYLNIGEHDSLSKDLLTVIAFSDILTLKIIYQQSC